jgi:glycosyltransferase involved in cell wall biosynthesis
LLIVGDIRAGEAQGFFDELQSSIPNSRIIITGYVSNRDLPSYYSVVEASAHPSLRDGLRTVLLEAIACGKAVTATQAGGVLDAVNDVSSLATVMQEVMSDKEMQKHLGRSACHVIESKFTLENQLNANLVLYRMPGWKV